ncbi:MAG TPA: isoleucine--tRNA ligase [Actinomycetota bacterium]|nr:isoleucine--tRNA ligase [Actinomycetota bacterium]
MPRYRPVDPKVNFPSLERGIIEFWRERRIFEKSLDLRKDSPEWVFYEGPPTANGKPGIHHVESRTFKDVYPRFKTMTGHFVFRKGGWDCHGLPVELEVEKEIGTKTKRDIEAFGVAEFNRLCRESVTRYVEDWEGLTQRIGFWLDLSDAYWTMTPEYIESVWWSLKELHRQGLLFEDDKSVAFCPRCSTSLSDHEVALGYTTVVDPSVFVKFRIVQAPDPGLVDSSIVAWTTTPWTLPSNLGLAVDPDETYERVLIDGEDLIIAKRLRTKVLGDGGRVKSTFKGQRLLVGRGTRYESLYPNVEGDVHRVVAADFVSMEEGTGVVHIAPGFGSEDLEIGRREGWPAYRPIDDFGRFTDETPVEWIRGKFVKDADPLITEDLRARGLLLRDEPYEHTYPLCWRCDTPLLYMAHASWYVRTTAKKDRLLAVNESVSWYPERIKHGRYGDWLENNVDWALSRQRYWGTPLPVWRCTNKHVTVVGSLKELSDLSGRDVTGVDPHRPDIDEITFPCPECGEESPRVPDLIDVWYDSGAMPFAQWGYHPELGRGVEAFRTRFPADFIAEAIDQTRGWFYSLMAEATLLFETTAYRNVVCLGLLLDAEGRKMSKSLGNVIDPWTVLDRHGADALRWFLISGGSPWADRRVSVEAVEDVVRQFLLTLWNVYSFFVTYANADGFDPAEHDVPPGGRPILDRWVLSQLARTVAEAREGLDQYDATGAGRRIERFVDDLSNWYLRRARRRFWDPARPQEAREKATAFLTLHDCLLTVAQLLAPFTPFISEEIWRNLAGRRDAAPESVHLSDYPQPDRSFVDDALDEAMQAARDIVELGRRVRNDARVKVRQPLRRAMVHYSGDRSALEPLLSLVAEELNLKEVVFSESAEELAEWRAKPNFRVLGPRLGPRVKDIAAALAADDGSRASALARGESVTVAVDGGQISLTPGDVDLVQETRAGWGAAAEGGLTVALDLEVTPDLRLEGLARDLVRLIQDARKAAGLEVTDRIDLAIEASGKTAEAVAAHREWIAGEVLAVRVDDGAPEGWDGARRELAELDGVEVGITLRRAT